MGKEVDIGEAHYCDIAEERIQKAIADKPERIKALYDSKCKEVDEEEER